MFTNRIHRMTPSPLGLVLPPIDQIASRSTLWLLLLVIAVDWLLSVTLRHQGTSLAMTQMSGILSSMTLIWWLSRSWPSAGRIGFWCRSGISIFLALGIRGALVQSALDLDVPEPWAWLPGIVASVVLSVIAVRYYGVTPSPTWTPAERWRLAVIGSVAYMVLLRLCYAGTFELLPEESYYWLYAQHLDIGYFDHPPLTAWTIAAGTAVFGDTPFGVRIGACGWWAVATIAMARFTRDLTDRDTAWLVVLLMAVLPYFTATGMLMFPEAPLVACWALALYFLQRALIQQHATAWIGVGVAIGLGMLAKYTIALLIPATVLYCLLARDARRWFAHPGPYVALLLSAVLFLPVVLWNMQHDWMSFRFQTVGRWQGKSEFSVHILLESAVALLGPTALAACAWWALRRWRGAPLPLFTAVFVLIPLSIFVVYSLRHAPRLNWTGPLWLAVLPAIALSMMHGPRWLLRLWPPTIAASLLAYAVFLHYAVLGFPGVSYPSKMIRLTGWEDLARQVANVVHLERTPTSQEPPVVACLDKYWIPSGLSFYLQDYDPRILVTSYQLFGRQALMFTLWHPPQSLAGRDLVLVSDDPDDFANERVRTCGTLVSPVTELPIRAPDGSQLGSYWYCVMRGYQPPDTQVTAP